LLNLGFGEKVNDEMEKLIKAKVPEFNLTTEQTYNNKKWTIPAFQSRHQGDMYFFNRYDASLKMKLIPPKTGCKPCTSIEGTALPLKKHLNLMEGRS